MSEFYRGIIIVPASHAANLSVVTEQMGYQQDFTLARKLVLKDDETATWDSPAVAYFTNDEAMPETIEQKFRLMSLGQFLPQVVWADTSITEVEANAAASSISFVSLSGAAAAAVNIDEFLGSLGYKFTPPADI